MAATRQTLLRAIEEAKLLAIELKDELQRDSTFRHSAVQELELLSRNVKTPTDQYWDIFFQPMVHFSLVSAAEAGWLDVLNGASGHVTVNYLAGGQEDKEATVLRLMRLLASKGIVHENGHAEYAATPLTDLLCSAPFSAGLQFSKVFIHELARRMPDYLARWNYAIAPSQGGTSHQESLHDFTFGEPLYQYITKHPEIAKVFDESMSTFRAGQRSWLDVYPLHTLTVKTFRDVLLVDVGGGVGHDLIQFATRKYSPEYAALHPSEMYTGRMILQDRPHVIAHFAGGWQDFVPMAHDFLTPQPETCHHARAYFIKNCLHNRQDDEVQQILQHLRNAMLPSYSTLLIDEFVVPVARSSMHPVLTSYRAAAMDVTMMAMCGTRERTETEWRELIQRVSGLQIQKIWQLDVGGESLIEVVRSW